MIRQERRRYVQRAGRGSVGHRGSGRRICAFPSADFRGESDRMVSIGCLMETVSAQDVRRVKLLAWHTGCDLLHVFYRSPH